MRYSFTPTKIKKRNKIAAEDVEILELYTSFVGMGHRPPIFRALGDINLPSDPAPHP